MAQDERNIRLAKMEELLKEIVKLKRKILIDKFSIAERLTTSEREELLKQYRTSIEEYGELLTTEVFEYLPGKISELLEQIPGIVTKITYYVLPLRPVKVTISEFIEDFIKESIENKNLIEIVLRRISEDGLTIEIPGESLKKQEEG